MSQIEMEQLHSFLCTLEIGSEAPLKWRIEGPLFRSATSTIFRATPVGNTEPIVAVKSTTPTEAREQHEAMELGRRQLYGSSNCHVPQSFGFLETKGLLAMEWIDAPSLKALILSPTTSRARLMRLTQQAGEWLGAFHNSDNETCPLNPSVMLDQIDEGREASEAGIPQGLEEAVRFLHSTSGRLSEHPMPKVLLHGDFKPSNFLVADNAMYSIDLAAQHVDAAVHDIAQFANQLILECYHPLALRHGINRHDYIRSFLSGYGTSPSAIPEFPLHWMMMAKFITQLLQLGNIPLISRKRFLGVCIQREIDLLLKGHSS